MTAATRATMGGLLVAAVGVLSINIFRAGEIGFSIVVAAVLLLAACAAWRLGVPGHALAGLVGPLLLALFGSYTIANITGADDGTAQYDETAALIIDGALALAGALTLYGAINYIVQRRRTGRRHAARV